jgi:preprotein translocase subunit SecG
MNLKDVLIDVLLVFFVIDCALMGLAIMMQRSKQEGLGTAFGGSVTSEIFGAGASAFLVRATVWLAAIFFILSICLARLYSQQNTVTEKPTAPLYQDLLKPVAPAPSSSNAVPVTPAGASATTPTATLSPGPATPAPTPAASTAKPAPAPAPTAAPAKPAGK